MIAKLAGKPLLLAFAAVIALVLAVGVVLALDGDEESESPDEAQASATAQPGGASPGAGAPASPTAAATSIPASAIPASPTPQADVWTIELLRTGGIAGLAQQAKIDSSGQATFEDQRAQRMVTRTLSPAVVSALKGLIDNSGFFGQAATQVSPCADCFQFKITLTMNARTYIVVANDVGLSPALKPLAERLTMLLQEGLQ